MTDIIINKVLIKVTLNKVYVTMDIIKYVTMDVTLVEPV